MRVKLKNTQSIPAKVPLKIGNPSINRVVRVREGLALMSCITPNVSHAVPTKGRMRSIKKIAIKTTIRIVNRIKAKTFTIVSGIIT